MDHLEVNIDLNKYVVRIKRTIKRITLTRFICSKIAYGQKISEVELAALFQNQLWLQMKSSSDYDFREKFGKDLNDLNSILKKSNFSKGLSNGSITRMRMALKEQLPTFLYPMRNLPAIESKLANSITVKFREPLGVPVSKLPSKAYIGKGYTDKGTAQKPEEDANPAWQIVAASNSNLLREMEEYVEKYNRNKSYTTSEKLQQYKEGARLVRLSKERFGRRNYQNPKKT